MNLTEGKAKAVATVWETYILECRTIDLAARMI